MNNKKINKKPNCIIAARSGSKRLKNKNILKVNGYPLIHIVIKTAIKSKIFDKIIVSTDSKKIANIAKKAGAQVPFLRNKKLSGGKIILLDVIKDIILKTDCKYKKFNFVIYPTAILTQVKDIKKANNKFIKKKSNFLISIKEQDSNALRSLVILPNNKLRFKWPNYIKKQSQDLKKYYQDSGNFFILKTDYFIKYGFNQKNVTYYEINKLSSVDINLKEDFIIAKRLYSNKNRII